MEVNNTPSFTSLPTAGADLSAEQGAGSDAANAQNSLSRLFFAVVNKVMDAAKENSNSGA